MNPRRWLFLFLLLLTGLRLWTAAQFELFPDEAYYRMWSERLDWAYFSKGPGVAMVIRLGTMLFGPTELGVRVFSPLLGLGTSLLVFFLARRIYNETIGIWAAFAVNCLPIFQAGSQVMTIDPLSIFFWTAALACFWEAIQTERRFSFWWPLTGLLIGLGFLCKYTNAVQLVSVVLFLALSGKHRREFRGIGFWSLILVFLVCAMPPVIWNAKHNWITLGHLGARGGLDHATGIHFDEFFKFVGAHFGVYSPVLFGAMLTALGWALPRIFVSGRKKFLLSFTLPLLVMYFLLAFRQAGEANWTAPAMISLGILSVALWHEKALQFRWARLVCTIGLGIGLAMSLAIANTDLLRSVGLPFPYAMDPSSRFRGWRTLAEEVDTFRKQYEAEHGTKVFLIGSDYGLCSELAFYMPNVRSEFPGHPPVYIPESQGIENQYSFWPRYDEYVDAKEAPATVEKDAYYTEEAGVNLFTGRTALYFTTRPENKPPTSLKGNGAFEKSRMIGVWQIKRRGDLVREVRVFACENYRGMSL